MAYFQPIADRLEININGLNFEDAQESCFSAVCNLCLDRKWEVIFELKESINHLVNSQGQTILAFCIIMNDETAFKKLLERKIAVSTISENNNLPIHVAAEMGILSFVQSLFEHNALTARNKDDQTPLHLAALNGNEEVVKYLLKNAPKSIDSLAHWKYGEQTFKLSPLAFSIIGGHIPCADLFITHPKNDLNLDLAGIGNFLHLAIFFHQTQLLSRFLTLYHNQFSALMERRNDSGQTPLMLAAYIGNEAAILLLIKKGVKLDTSNAYGDTALHWAVRGGQKNAVTLLIARQANYLQENQDDLDPMRLAASLEQSSMQAYLKNIKSAGGIQGVPGYEVSKPRILVLKGGGIKGLGHGGILQGLEKYQMMDEVEIIGGTSAGSMIGGLIAVGYKSPEFIEIYRSINFMDLFDHPVIDLKNAIKSPTFKNTFTLLKTIAGAIINPVGTTVKVIANAVNALWHTTGICKGKKARKLMEKYISKATAIPFMTFKELRQEIEAGKPYKHFHAFATKIGPNPEILDMNSQDPKWDDVIISDAIRGSMSIPGVFQPHRLHVKVNGERLPHPENFVLVDGGMLHNLPIESFDRKRYVTKDYTAQEANIPVFNSRVLGISLYDPKDKVAKPDQEPENIMQFLFNLASIYFGAEDLIRNLNPHNRTRIVEASTCGFGTLKFNLTESEKMQLLAEGLKAIEEFMEQRIEGFAQLNLEESLLEPVEQEAAIMTFSQLASRTINRAPGVYALGVCESLACAGLNKNQWIKIGSSETKEIDVGEAKSNFRCPCCKDPFPGIKQVAVSGFSATVIYGDDEGKHEQNLVSQNGQAEIIAWSGNLRYLRFKDFK